MEERITDSRGQGLDKKLGERPRLNGHFSLLDGASAQIPVIAPELTSLSKIVSDKTRPLEERLESLEIILDLEVGYTNLNRGRNIEREIGLRQIYLKFEGGNPTGTQKDRIAFAQALDAIDWSLRNDWTTDPVAQQYICHTVDCLVAYLETLI